ncbi:purine/pyrimidine permease [Brevibacterium sp. 50QC2O2]|uniref:uracil-xanthine permease family protein n=1 Tax=Brevibacterium TaxID=1696 RepID=UPI00211C69A8|nr:purine/pyrimidine permease [Brevibacterium sp. 91QC2O2]MCQ9385671.1 purine/pyrimidine permease [Brevibacterium sp. 68QC2CO]MCQ9389575.1 purine/pyrimidine permease [Brevibacterium sp. 50QC2O2]
MTSTVTNPVNNPDNEPGQRTADQPLAVGFDQHYSIGRAIPLGGQHLLALNGLWVFPISLGAGLHLDNVQTSFLIQGCFLLTGLVTLLSSTKVLKLPIVQGPTAALLVALIAGGSAFGLDAAFGSMVVAGLLSAVLAFPLKRLGLYGHIAQFVGNPLVFGTMFLVLGAQLAQIGVGGWFTDSAGMPLGAALATGIVTIVVVALCMIFGGKTIIKTAAVLWGIAVGAIVAAVLGVWQLPDLSGTLVLGPPHLLPFGFKLEWALVPLMMVGFLQAASESMGVYSLLGRIGGERIDVDRANRGLFVEFIGSSIGGLFGGIGTTSYPENVGVLRVTGIASRVVTATAGVIAIVVSFLPPVALFLASLPTPAMYGAATVLFGIIAFSGVQQLAVVKWDNLNLLVAALCFTVPVGLQAIPAGVAEGLPESVSSILTSPMMVSTIMLLVLHPLINFGVRPLLERRRAA